MSNPFPDPETIDSSINKEVKDYIDNQLESTGKLMFFDVMSKLEDSVTKKNIKLATIIAYYLTNSILKSHLSEFDKWDIIRGVKESIDSIS